MTPKKAPKGKWNGVDRRAPWGGACRRRRKARSVEWRRTTIGLCIIAVAVALRLVIRDGFDAFAMILAVVGAAMVDYEAVKVGSRMFSIRRGSGNTEENPTWSRGE